MSKTIILLPIDLSLQIYRGVHELNKSQNMNNYWNFIMRSVLERLEVGKPVVTKKKELTCFLKYETTML